MAEADEPHFTTLSQRIAALSKQQGQLNGVPTGKRPPPPPPPIAPRPPLPARGQTTNNPPIATYGSSVTKQSNNQPIAAKNLLPPPGLDQENTRNATSPRLPPRAPPPLPSRKASSPALPPRNACTAVSLRRGSNDSATSLSALSSTSYGTLTSTSSTEGRKLPPPLEQANLPPLPPTKREREATAARLKAEKAEKAPLVSAKTVPLLPSEFPATRAIPPVPPRPNAAPRLPARPSRGNLLEAAGSVVSSPDVSPRLSARPSCGDLRGEAGPALPVRPKLPSRPGSALEDAPILPRRLPPPSAARSVLTMGFNNKPKTKETPKETPNPEPSRPPVISRPSPSGVIELTPSNFDSIMFAGKPALVDFYTTYCRYCVELEPVWNQLGQDFTSDKFIIAKCNVEAHTSFKERFDIQGYPTILFFDGHTSATEKYPYLRTYERISKFIEQKTEVTASSQASIPPLINISSKPSRPHVQALQATPNGCLICRDYTGPDTVATQHPRESLSHVPDPIHHLASVLCGPFPSATDKARAIFTWLHHNIAYDVASFFSNNVRNVTPSETISSGVAVCGGYAGVFSAIALKAGLEAVTVTGHGKGYGYTALQPGEKIPACDPSGHAWNAVRIDNGQWKLIDACWGAGNVGNQAYNKRFTAGWFTRSNEEFGRKHFPQERRFFFRNDGNVPSWEEYFLGEAGEEPVTVMGAVDEHGISESSFSPLQKRINVHTNDFVRFQFSKLCEHWNHERHGKGQPYCMILKISGVEGRKDDFVPFEKDENWWWVDVPARELGAPGMKIMLFAVTTVNGADARGLEREGYLKKKGRAAMGFAGVAEWICV